jgi:hypothetical protein
MARLPTETRERILARDGFRCSARFLGGACDTILDVHHIRPREEGGTDEDDNLMVLCHSHHPMLESIRKAILAKRRPEWKRCNRHHRSAQARYECERRLNRHLLAA